MSYYLDSKYPFHPANLQGSITENKINDTSKRYGWNYRIDEKSNCIDIKYKLNNQYDVMFGSNKPIDEKCTNITGQLTYDPSNSTNSLWNNSTRRKIIVNNTKN